jgi:uncharacterized protein
MMEILKATSSLNLPDWWICAGFVRAKIWDVLHDFDERTPTPDIDVIYYDSINIDEKTEKQYEKGLKKILPTSLGQLKTKQECMLRIISPLIVLLSTQFRSFLKQQRL